MGLFLSFFFPLFFLSHFPTVSRVMRFVRTTIRHQQTAPLASVRNHGRLGCSACLPLINLRLGRGLHVRAAQSSCMLHVRFYRPACASSGVRTLSLEVEMKRNCRRSTPQDPLHRRMLGTRRITGQARDHTLPHTWLNGDPTRYVPCTFVHSILAHAWYKAVDLDTTQLHAAERQSNELQGSGGRNGVLRWREK